MNVRRIWALAALTALAACGGGEPAQQAPATETATPASTPAAAPSATVDLAGLTLPEGVTAEMVNAGAAAWPTQACIACHGQDAKGVPPLAPDLTDGNWLHVDGTFESIQALILSGVPQPKESAGPMLPRGGTAIDDVMVANLAAYIWAIAHPGA